MYQTILFEYLMVSLAVVLSLKLYRSGHPPPTDGSRLSAIATGPTELKDLPGRRTTAHPDAARLAETLRRFADGGEEVEALVEGAKLAYETIVLAFAYGNLEGHRHLLTEPVRESFERDIAERHARGEAVSTIFIGFSTAEILAAGLEGNRAWMQVHFVADLVTVIRRGDGRIVAGDPERVVQADEAWTFERDVCDPGPDWLLAATESLA